MNQIKKSYVSHPDRIDDIECPIEICENFSDKYKLILNKKQRPPIDACCRLNISEKKKQLFLLRFSLADVVQAISCLNTGIGFDDIHSWHLKLSPPICHELISMLFFSFIVL